MRPKSANGFLGSNRLIGLVRQNDTTEIQQNFCAKIGAQRISKGFNENHRGWAHQEFNKNHWGSYGLFEICWAHSGSLALEEPYEKSEAHWFKTLSPDSSFAVINSPSPLAKLPGEKMARENIAKKKWLGPLISFRSLFTLLLTTNVSKFKRWNDALVSEMRPQRLVAAKRFTIPTKILC